MKFNQWQDYVFSDFIEINPSIRLDNKKEYSFIEMKDLSDARKFAFPSVKRKVTGGARFSNMDTLFARITPCLENGKICQATNLENNVGFGSTEFLVFRGRDKVSDPDFVYYLSRSEKVRGFAEQNLVGTSGRQRVGKEAFQKLVLNLPPLSVQKKIASILSSLDDKIELNRQTNQTLEAIAHALFKEWFVDFNFPGATGEMQESELGEIPKGWTVGRLGDILSFKNGKSSPERNNNFEYPVYGANGIIGYSKSFNSNGKNIVIGRVGSYCGAVYYTVEKSFITENAIVAENKYKNSSVFCYITLQNLKLNNFRVGSGQPLLNQTILSSIKIFVPSINVIERFEEVAYSFYSSIYENENQSSILTELRDTLLPKLMKGEIKIK
jgi:type I restriction enzyme S subunit